MIKDFKKLFKITASLVVGSLILWHCEPDSDQLGSQFFQNGAQGTEETFPLIAYNVINGDTIRTDRDRLQSATLGAFNEPQFGLQKSAYVTQVRLSSNAPNFGTNPILDSAVMIIKPAYQIDSATVTTDENYIYPVGAVPAKKVVTTYPILKYGKSKLNGKTIFNININEVTEFLSSGTNEIRSNKTVTTGALLGSKVFNGDINAIKITKDSDNSTLNEKEAGIRIALDSTFFQNKIISKTGTPELADAATFTRYIRGLRISVVENDGYIFNFDPNGIGLTLYYKKDKVEGTTTTRENATYALDLTRNNTKFNQITYDRAGTPSATPVTDTIMGASKLYAQGMGGPGMGLKIPQATIAAIKDLYNNDKIGIVSAKLRIFTDVATWNNNYTKPDYFTVKQKNLNTYLQDMTILAASGVYNLVKPYDLKKNPAYYDIGITYTFKQIIEKEQINRDFILNVGNYTYGATNTLDGLDFGTEKTQQNFNTRSFTPYRAVFVGTDPGNPNSAKLLVTYGKK